MMWAEGIKAVAVGVAAVGSSMVGGAVGSEVVTQNAAASQFIVSFTDIVTLATFITGPPTMVMLLAWKFIYSRIDKLGVQIDAEMTDHIKQWHTNGDD